MDQQKNLKDNILSQEKSIEIYKSFSVPIEKEVKGIGENGEDITNTISCKLKFIDSARFIVNSLSYLVNNLIEDIHKVNVNTVMIIKNAKRVELDTKIVSAALNTEMLKMI